jgi:hypothetical protein
MKIIIKKQNRYIYEEAKNKNDMYYLVFDDGINQEYYITEFFIFYDSFYNELSFHRSYESKVFDYYRC